MSDQKGAAIQFRFALTSRQRELQRKPIRDGASEKTQRELQRRGNLCSRHAQLQIYIPLHKSNLQQKRNEVRRNLTLFLYLSHTPNLYYIEVKALEYAVVWTLQFRHLIYHP